MSWKKVKIGDFLKRIKRPVVLEAEKEYKLVTIRINQKGVSLREVKRGADIKSNMYEVKEGDFILSGIDARNGAFGIIPKELDGAIVTNDFWYFELDEALINKHFFLELTATSWFKEICDKGSDGTTQRIRLQKDKFFTQEIELPSVEEQNQLTLRIRDKRDKISLLQQEILKQKEYVLNLKKTILQDAISGKLTEQWRAENRDVEPASELIKKIKAEKQELIEAGKIRKEKPLSPIMDSEIPFDVPDTWEWCRLGDLCSKTGSGSTPKGGRDAYPASGVYFLRSQNVYNDGIKLDGIVYISENTHERMQGTKVFPDDLLLNITGGSIGRCAIVSNKIKEANINQHVAIIRLIDRELLNYIHSAIISGYFYKKIEECQTGAGREGLPKNKMDNILLPIPPKEEIKVMSTLLQDKLSVCTSIEDQIKDNQYKAEMLLRSILSEMLK